MYRVYQAKVEENFFFFWGVSEKGCGSFSVQEVDCDEVFIDLKPEEYVKNGIQVA